MTSASAAIASAALRAAFVTGSTVTTRRLPFLAGRQRPASVPSTSTAPGAPIPLRARARSSRSGNSVSRSRWYEVRVERSEQPGARRRGRVAQALRVVGEDERAAVTELDLLQLAG